MLAPTSQSGRTEIQYQDLENVLSTFRVKNANMLIIYSVHFSDFYLLYFFIFWWKVGGE